MVFSIELTYAKIVNMPEIKYIAGLTIVYTLAPSIYENSDLTLQLKSSFPNEVGVNNVIGDIRRKSIFTTNKTITLMKSLFSIPY